ncbi:TetR family transcriptional regulator [Halarcobacter ebronensis]|uniref:TetR family transcriptional regulator n=1 Tax=Halarcobacter ebronensis TaxID=1462615 RepID=A0A4Q0YA91_9BACT|nr:TetR/AcrR family transcriptional regulator [Halarcobacter ebronensis]RXJ66795.1 TetR family transcriptional regulator [Halarcobacter ebronensis]
MRKKELTQEKIKKVATKLFNEKDSLSITTNHIAKEANISPGNLYYHYKNKEAIILEIYKDMSKKFESFESFNKILTSKNSIKTWNEMYDSYLELFWEYRFLMKDNTTLMAIYPELKKIFSEKQKIRIEQIKKLYRYWIEEQIITPIDEKELHIRAKLSWFVSAYWQVFTSIDSDITKESIKEVKEIIFKLQLYPLLTNKGKELLKE